MKECTFVEFILVGHIYVHEAVVDITFLGLTELVLEATSIYTK